MNDRTLLYSQRPVSILIKTFYSPLHFNYSRVCFSPTHFQPSPYKTLIKTGRIRAQNGSLAHWTPPSHGFSFSILDSVGYILLVIYINSIFVSFQVSVNETYISAIFPVPFILLSIFPSIYLLRNKEEKKTWVFKLRLLCQKKISKIMVACVCLTMASNDYLWGVHVLSKLTFSSLVKKEWEISFGEKT